MINPPAHPGEIVYLDGATQKEVKRVKISQVPADLRYAPTSKGEVPVVKVVGHYEGNQHIIREYGPGGELLRSTVQLEEPKR